MGDTLTPLALSAADLGRLLGVSRREVYNWHASGALGPVPVVLSERHTLGRRGDRGMVASLPSGRAADRPRGMAAEGGPRQWLKGNPFSTFYTTPGQGPYHLPASSHSCICAGGKDQTAKPGRAWTPSRRTWAWMNAIAGGS